MFPDTGKTDKQTVMIGSVTAAGGVAVLAIIGLVVLFIKYRITRLMMNRNKVGDLYTTQDEQISRKNAYVQEEDVIEKEDFFKATKNYFPFIFCGITVIACQCTLNL